MNRHDAKTIISGSVFVPSVILEAHMMDENQFVRVAARLDVFFRVNVKKRRKKIRVAFKLEMHIRSQGERTIPKINKRVECRVGGGDGFSLKSQLNTKISKDPRFSGRLICFLVDKQTSHCAIYKWSN